MRNERVRNWMPWIVGLSTVMLVLGLVSIPSLQAQVEETPPQPPPEAEKHNPFELYPADPGAVTYGDLLTGPRQAVDTDTLVPGEGIDEATYRQLTAETQASVDDVGAWADVHNGYDSAQAWSAYTDLMVTRAQLKSAEYLSGLSNIGDLGTP